MSHAVDVNVFSAVAPVPKQRFLSLDVFRGLSMFAMILVNTPGAGATPFRQLVHAPWLGFTFADLVFPSFLFASGIALSFVSPGIGDDKAFLLKLGKRAALIFTLGVLMYLFPFFHFQADGSLAWTALGQARITGVLQRIALSYAVAAIATRYLSVRALLVLCTALLLGYWILLFLGSAPGMALDKHHNIGTRIDLALFGPGHLYKKDGGFDPEGLLGSLPAIVNVIAGYLCGHHIRRHGTTTGVTGRLAAIGIALVLLALAWNPWFAIAKKLWTSSFVLCTVGLDLIIIAALLQWIEVAGHKRGSSFFVILGTNALVIYLFSELFAVVLKLIPAGDGMNLLSWLGIEIFQRVAPGPVGSLLTAITYTMTCWLLAWEMDRRHIHVRL